MKLGFFSFLLFISTLEASSQLVSPQYLIHFKVKRIGTHINTQWRTGIDFTCSDVDLYYGKDSNAMELIYSYPGICGSEKKEKDYAYIHNNPPAGMAYYQLYLGIYGKSHIQKIDIQKPEDYLIYPNPSKDILKMEFPTYELGTVTLQFFTPNGNNLLQKTFNVKEVNLDISKFPSGFIYFKADFSAYGKVIQGKIAKIE